MVGVSVAATTDRPRTGAVPARWGEQWTFDAVSPGAGLAVSVGVGRRPGTGRGWYWAVVAAAGQPVVVVADPDVALPPAPGSLEFRASGLWADHHATEPLGHWSVANEAFGVALDDPWQAWGRGLGDRTAVGLDLEWDPVATVVALPAGDGPDAGAWAVGCEVVGEVLVGADRHELDGTGVRGHRWGLTGVAPVGHTELGWFADGVWHHLATPDTAPVLPAGPGPWGVVTDHQPPHRGVSVDVVAWAPVMAAGNCAVAMAVVAVDGHHGWLRHVVG